MGERKSGEREWRESAWRESARARARGRARVGEWEGGERREGERLDSGAGCTSVSAMNTERTRNEDKAHDHKHAMGRER